MSNIYNQTGQKTLQEAGGAPHGARQPEIHAAQDEQSEITIMQEVWCRKRNVGTP